MAWAVIMEANLEIVKDYYKGFEGEPEIIFIRADKNGERAAISMWIGYFDELMSVLEPGEDGWAGLALPYNLHTGWYDESPWAIPKSEVELVLKQIVKSRQFQADDTVVRICDDLIKMISIAIKNQEEVFIAYE